MPEENFERLRLAVMQDFLPVGLAMAERIRKGGPGKVLEAFTDSSAPIQELRDEGSDAARDFRDQLDKISPGLGNPVMSVKVGVQDSPTSPEDLI